MRAGWIVAGPLAIAIAAASAASAEPARLLDVPFVSQSELLCGGAAAAMVLRHGGAAGVRADEFAPLVDRDAGGIRQSALVAAIEARGWTVRRLADDTDAEMQQALARNQPVIALLQQRPGLYHYIVIVGWTSGHVVFHDPALAPYRVLDRATFDRAWSGTGRWAIATTPASRAASNAPSQPVPTAERSTDDYSPCAGLVDEGARLAHAGDRRAAASALEASVTFCPESAAAHVELAGLRFLDGRWGDAAALAERATEIGRADAHAWRILASSRFLEGDHDGALEAWNAAGEPRLDLIQVTGLARTRHRAVEALVPLAPDDLLTSEALTRARRRIAEVPSLSASRVTYRPVADGHANIEVAVVERPVRPSTTELAARAIRAAVEREVRADVSSLTRGGERLELAWRFWENRPAVRAAVNFPALFGASGLWSIDVGWSRQPYATGDGVIATDERRHAALAYSDWLTGTTQTRLTVGVDRWDGRSISPSFGGGIDQRLLGDHVSVRAEGAVWPAGNGAFGSGGLSLAWRAGDPGAVALEGRGGVEAASAGAPFDLWPGAGAGHVRAPLLRAHPLLTDGVVEGPAFGQRLAHASVEASHAILRRGPGRIDGVLFVDAARAWRTVSGDRSLHVDVGAGVRLRAFTNGALAVDIARGTRDGRTAITAGWVAAWPER